MNKEIISQALNFSLGYLQGAPDYLPNKEIPIRLLQSAIKELNK